MANFGQSSGTSPSRRDREVVCRLCSIRDNECEIDRSVSEMQPLEEAPAAVAKQAVSSR